MHKRIIDTLWLSLIFATMLCVCQGRPNKIKDTKSIKTNLIFLDTTGRDKWLYKPFIDVLESVGWLVTYRSIDQIMDLCPKRLNLNSYKAALFFFGTEFLKGTSKSPVAAKIMLLLQQYSKLSDRVIGLIFPPFNAPSSANIVGSLAAIFNNIGTSTPLGQLTFPNLDVNTSLIQKEDAYKKNFDTFFYVANTFLTKPIESRPLGYHTTLHEPREGTSFYTAEVEKILQAADIRLKMLPISQQFSSVVKQTFPYGLYWFNPLFKNHIFLAQSTIFSFSGISECFHFCPIDYVLRKEINKGVQQMIWELLSLTQNIKNPNNSEPAILKLPEDIALPWSISSMGSPLDKTNKLSPTRKIAWMETTIFEPEKLDKTVSSTADNQIQQNRGLQQDKLIDYIFLANLDTLWLSASPNMYFSAIARKKKETAHFLDGISCFTQKLAAAAKQKNKAFPNIFIGFEIANNLYEPNLPRQCSVDLYGNLYKDIPSALDRSFWLNEVKRPLDDFLNQWKNPKISHGVPISGVVLDLEMYCRKSSGQFLTCMGFDQISFANFTRRHQLNCKNMSPHEKASYLMNNKQTSQYFSFLEEDAERLGTGIKKFLNKKIPQCQIACYLPSILINWFYKGLYKGLSCQKRPLQLFTFNAEFQSHREWFETNKLPVQHSSVLLLSKIKQPADFAQVNVVLQHHNGIWLNRFSRMIEQKSKDWGAVERPSIGESEYNNFCAHISNVV